MWQHPGNYVTIKPRAGNRMLTLQQVSSEGHLEFPTSINGFRMKIFIGIRKFSIKTSEGWTECKLSMKAILNRIVKHQTQLKEES